MKTQEFNLKKTYQKPFSAVAQAFSEFTTFYAQDTTIVQGKSKYVFPQANLLKISWDFFILLELIFISITVPYRICFLDNDSKNWKAFYTWIDVCFGIDILLTFNTSYSETDAMLEIYSRKKIAINYLKGWFIIDLVSIIPFDFLFQGKTNVTAVAKFARIGRLYKLIRMTRLAKLLKLLKSKNTIVT